MTAAPQDLTTWTGARAPDPTAILAGHRVRLEPLDAARHAADLYEAAQGAGADPDLWRYMGYGPFADADALRRWIVEHQNSADPVFFAIVETAGGRASGWCSFLRIDTVNGVIEIGHIWFGARIQRTAVATEAIHLLGRHAFDDLGHRRLEWKCDAANARSRAAAARFGFTYEGTFRQHMVVKGRNRDTAWFSITDGEWPRIRAAFEQWLDPENFDADGGQRTPLRARTPA
jgi:RimJ/RimL family protein N-acetyltransferase